MCDSHALIAKLQRIIPPKKGGKRKKPSPFPEVLNYESLNGVKQTQNCLPATLCQFLPQETQDKKESQSHFPHFTAVCVVLYEKPYNEWGRLLVVVV